MKKILYLTFYFEPDLCAGSFRNTPLAYELVKLGEGLVHVDVITTLPNRYSSFEVEAQELEQKENLTVHRVKIPKHQSGMKDQIISFKTYYDRVKKLINGERYDLVFASSSRLFTAYLGYTVAKKLQVPLYLDIRDIFYDTLDDVLQSGIIKRGALPLIKRVEKKTFNYATHINLISGGFEPYFANFEHAHFSFYPNGIDDIFIEYNETSTEIQDLNEPKTIVYAGNLGEGQGLHKIIPKAAKELQGKFKFIIIGDGGAKAKLEQELIKLNVTNVEIYPPIKRDKLLSVYKKADFLFVHLNNYKAFEKVLPSKLFELASFSKPIIAGVGGFAANFIKENIENTILFEPCNIDEFVEKIRKYEYKTFSRTAFIEKFKRSSVNRKMAFSILKYIQ